MDEDFDSDAFDESEYSDDEVEDMNVNNDTSTQKQTEKVAKKGQKHLEELKSSLGLTEFQNKADLKREKRRRQKARRKLKKAEIKNDAQIQTKATKLKAAKIVPEVVTYLDPKKRPKKEKNEGFETPKNNTENSDDSEITMKQARFDVFKFGIRGLDKDGQQEARVALALRLGAKPDKKSCLPYAQYKEKIKQEKSDLQTRKEMEKLTGMRKASTRPVSTKKSKKGKNEEQNPAKKKKKHNEATPLKFGKFDGGTVRLSKKELSNISGKKK